MDREQTVPCGPRPYIQLRSGTALPIKVRTTMFIAARTTHSKVVHDHTVPFGLRALSVRSGTTLFIAVPAHIVHCGPRPHSPLRYATTLSIVVRDHYVYCGQDHTFHCGP